jgi:hypothetical protein
MVSLEPLTHKLLGIWTNHQATISSLLPHSIPTKAECLTKLKIYNWHSEEGGRTNNGLVILNSEIRKYSKSIPLALPFFKIFLMRPSPRTMKESLHARFSLRLWCTLVRFVKTFTLFNLSNNPNKMPTQMLLLSSCCYNTCGHIHNTSFSS